jgi:hypothetical protein
VYVRKSAIIRNAVKCLKCDEVIESKTRHDLVSCKCGNVFVDGGKEYLRRGFKTREWKELSEEKV